MANIRMDDVIREWHYVIFDRDHSAFFSENEIEHAGICRIFALASIFARPNFALLPSSLENLSQARFSLLRLESKGVFG